MHDDANDLAAAKCKLLWLNVEYDKTHEALMQTLRHGGGREADSSAEKSGVTSATSGHDEKELSDKLETLDDGIKDLNHYVDKLEENYYKKYDDKDLATLNSDVKALVTKCKP
jgi:hypothetical protein